MWGNILTHIGMHHTVSPKTAIAISSSFVREQWGHYHSFKVVGFESCAVLPVVEALLFALIVNVYLED
jgi:hypothetical protein